MKTNKFLFHPLKAYLKDGKIYFNKKTYINRYEECEEEIKTVLKVIRKETEKINRDLENYNRAVETNIWEFLDEIREHQTDYGIQFIPAFRLSHNH